MEDKATINYDFEIKRLKQKCNLQLDKIILLEKELEALKNQRIPLIQTSKINSEKNQRKNTSEKQDLFSVFIDQIKIVHKVFLNIVQGNSVIPYKNNSQNSQEFYKVEKAALDKALATFIDEKKTENIFNFCAEFGIFRVDKNGRYIFNTVQDGRSCRVYMIKKTIMDYLTRMEEKENA